MTTQRNSNARLSTTHQRRGQTDKADDPEGIDENPAPRDDAAVPDIDTSIDCDDCTACCCQLEVLLLTDTGVPGHLTETDAWGAPVMARLDDGWCAALDRQTLRCSIYEHRPWVCRALEMGGQGCVDARQAFADSISPHG